MCEANGIFFVFGSQASASDDTLLRVDESLEAMSREDPAAAQLVELRFFGGLKMEEAALALGVTDRTTRRYWRFARAWLHDNALCPERLKPSPDQTVRTEGKKGNEGSNLADRGRVAQATGRRVSRPTARRACGDNKIFVTRMCAPPYLRRVPGECGRVARATHIREQNLRSVGLPIRRPMDDPPVLPATAARAGRSVERG